MEELLTNLFGFVINFFWPNKLKEIQIKITRLNVNNLQETDEFIQVYEETFPMDGSNYTVDDLLGLLEDIRNSKKHVVADNIILVAKFKGSIIGFLLCFYYPEQSAGIIGYLGKRKSHPDEWKFVTGKLLKGLKFILTKEHNCKYLVYELEFPKRGQSKAKLFKRYAENLGLAPEHLQIDYYRPKLNLEDPKEESLELFILPFEQSKTPFYKKAQVMDILSFIHLCCYGDFYEKEDPKHLEFHEYLNTRLQYYKNILPEKILIM